MSTFTVETATSQETEQLGRRLAAVLRQGDVVALVGPLGAGKTQLTRGLAAGRGADPRQVASPTFILMSEYQAPVPVVHIDAYRIQSLADLESIGFVDELLEQSITVIEWADRIARELPADHLWIELAHTSVGRQITVTARGSLAQRESELRAAIGPSETAATPPRCRTCGRPVEEDAATFPFCCDRCRLVDLNRWFKGGYSLSRPLDEGDDTSSLSSSSDHR